LHVLPPERAACLKIIVEGNLLSPNGIRAIFFDLDGTLRHNEPAPEKVIFDLAVKLGAPESAEKRRQALRWVHYYWAQSPEMLRDVEIYKESEEGFWSNYIRQNLVAFDCPSHLLEQIFPPVYSFMNEQYKPQDRVIPGVLETLEKLKAAGFGLAVVSNRTKPYLEQLRALNLEGYFELVVAAGEIEAWKPEPGIFLHALQEMDLKADETIYVGDNYFADVIGARRAGLLPVLLDPEAIFPDPGCVVLNSVADLLVLLEEHQPQSGSYASPNH
jgi:HAD superfamily hydrolase (TIGR01662 family)